MTQDQADQLPEGLYWLEARSEYRTLMHVTVNKDGKRRFLRAVQEYPIQWEDFNRAVKVNLDAERILADVLAEASMPDGRVAYEVGYEAGRAEASVLIAALRKVRLTLLPLTTRVLVPLELSEVDELIRKTIREWEEGERSQG